MTETRGSEIVVFWARGAATCDACGEDLGRGSLTRLEDRKAFCLECADLDHLVFLPSGDAALTRRASKHSKLRAVVVRWSTARRRYERQGVLVEEPALSRAEEECLGDAEARAAQRVRDAQRREHLDLEYIDRFPGTVGKRYPGCLAGEHREIAEHACRKYSGRLGRTAGAKSLDPVAIDLAVRAHVRHARTPYDDLLMAGRDRGLARAEVEGEVDDLLTHWRSGEGAARGPE
jgi:hypothetical protein